MLPAAPDPAPTAEAAPDEDGFKADLLRVLRGLVRPDIRGNKHQLI